MESNLPFGKKNYHWMITGVVLLVVGLIIMCLDTQPHGFGFLGLTLGPIVMMGGFIVELYAILHNPTK
jgi:Protein of unknown function (DUF3098)